MALLDNLLSGGLPTAGAEQQEALLADLFRRLQSGQAQMESATTTTPPVDSRAGMFSPSSAAARGMQMPSEAPPLVERQVQSAPQPGVPYQPPSPAVVPQDIAAKQAPVPSAQAPLPQRQANVWDHLGALARGYNSGGLIGGIADMANTGRNTDDHNQTVKAIAGRIGDPEMAQMIGRDPALVKAVIPLLFKQQLGLQGNKRSLNPVWGVDAQGKPVLMQLGERGDAVATALPPGVTPNPGGTSRVDLGTEFGILDRSGQLIGRVPKDVAGEARAKETGKTEAERAAARPKAEATLRNLDAGQKLVTDTIDQVLERVSGWNTGAMGAIVSRVPGTPGYDIARALDTIKANVGFDKLQDMRDNSPTGGALGQVAVQELQMLQAVIGSLDQAQSPEQFARSLATAKLFLQGAAERRRQAFAATYGSAPSQPMGAAPEATPAQKPDPLGIR